MKKAFLFVLCTALVGSTFLSSCKNKGGTRSGGGGRPINSYHAAPSNSVAS